MPHTVRAIAVDGHGVVYTRRCEVPDGLVAHLHARGELSVPAEAARRIYIELQERTFCEEITYWEMLREFAARTGMDRPDAVDELHQQVQRRSADIVLNAELVTVLSELRRRGVKIAMLTNSIHSAQTKWDWLRKQRVDALFDHIYSSVESGYRKPDPRIFNAFAAQLGLAPAEVVFVGHDQAELQGAHKAGLRTVCLGGECARSEFQVERLGEILDLPIWPREPIGRG